MVITHHLTFGDKTTQIHDRGSEWIFIAPVGAGAEGVRCDTLRDAIVEGNRRGGLYTYRKVPMSVHAKHLGLT